jgi:thiol:disulfide interchange protein DsbD
MIPITVSFFTKRSKNRREGIKNAIYYSLSIIIIFTVFGLLISRIYGRDALYLISTNWILNLFFFLLFVIFGISFLGAFEISLPSSWTNKTDSRAGLGSFTGIFFMALTLVIVSFSCTGPIVVMLLSLSAEGGWAGPIIGMFAFSLGLSLPFSLCAIFPAVINKLGKAGGWLNQVKVTLGFIELGLALKFFSNADLLKQWRILDREIFLAIWIVLSVLLGMYLLGKIKLSHDDEPKKNVYGQEYISIFKLFLAIASFTFALYLLPGMWGAPLNGLGQFLPNMGTQDFVLTPCDESGASTSSAPKTTNDPSKPVKFVKNMRIYEPNVVRNNGLITYYDYQEALEACRKLKKPLMLDFTGITCVNCRAMETAVWSDPEVIKRLKNDFILVSLYDDAREIPLAREDCYVSKVSGKQITTLGDKCLDIEIDKYNSNGMPMYFFIDENETKLADNGYPYIPDVKKFVEHLESVKAKYKKTHS